MSDDINSSIQNLTKQYNSLLKEYQITNDEYNNYLKISVSTTNNFSQLKSSPKAQHYQNKLKYINDNNISTVNDIDTNKILGKNYNSLLNERRYIDNYIREEDYLQQQLDTTDDFTTESYSRYILLLGITIILFFLLFKYLLIGNQQQGGGDKNIKSDVIFLLSIMIVFLGLANIFKNLNLLIFLTIVIILYIFIKIKKHD